MTGYTTQPTSSKAIASVVLGIVGMFVCGLLFGGAAIVLALMAKQNTDTGKEKGSGLVIAGIILGVIAACGHLACMVFFPELSEPDIPTYYL